MGCLIYAFYSFSQAGTAIQTRGYSSTPMTREFLILKRGRGGGGGGGSIQKTKPVVFNNALPPATCAPGRSRERERSPSAAAADQRHRHVVRPREDRAGMVVDDMSAPCPFWWASLPGVCCSGVSSHFGAQRTDSLTPPLPPPPARALSFHYFPRLLFTLAVRS